MGNPPDIIAINHDDYYAKHVGRTADGRQFILTTPFEPAIGERHGSEYVALYLFDTKGKLIEARIENFGPRATLDNQKRHQVYDQWLRDLGAITFGRIEVTPFAVKRFGATFGLILRELEYEDDSWVVEMQPGNYMAFFEPWDSGEFDT